MRRVVFVDLAQVRDPALVMAELSQAVGVELRGGGDLIGQLAAAVGNEERLVVLDTAKICWPRLPTSAGCSLPVPGCGARHHRNGSVSASASCGCTCIIQEP